MHYNSSYLCHWKYIKREKVNGKWRYWYDIFDKSSGQKKIVTPEKTSASEKSADKTSKTADTGLKITKIIDSMSGSKINTTASDTMVNNAKSFVSTLFNKGLGAAIYSVVAPAMVSVQVAVNTPNSFSDLKKNKNFESQSNEDHQNAINSDYNQDTYDYSQNCSFCTAAYDLRKRGYDVEANPISYVEGYTVDDILSWYDDPKPYSAAIEDGTSPETVEAVKEALASNGEGSRGHLCLYWTNGGGHDVIWEVENGEVIIRDCQLNTVVPLELYLAYSRGLTYFRTDNLEPNENILRTVRNRK